MCAFKLIYSPALFNVHFNVIQLMKCLNTIQQQIKKRSAQREAEAVRQKKESKLLTMILYSISDANDETEIKTKSLIYASSLNRILMLYFCYTFRFQLTTICNGITFKPKKLTDTANIQEVN